MSGIRRGNSFLIKKSIIGPLLQLHRFLEKHERFDSATELLHALAAARIRGCGSRWFDFTGMFHSFSGPVSIADAHWLALSAYSGIVLPTIAPPDYLVSFVKLQRIYDPRMDDDEVRVLVRYLPILTHGVPGVLVETRVRLSRLRRLLRQLNVSRYPLSRISLVSGVYAYLLYPRGSSKPTGISMSAEVLKYNERLLKQRYCTDGRGRRFSCPVCKVVHVGYYKGCPYWQLHGTLRECLQELSTLR